MRSMIGVFLAIVDGEENVRSFERLYLNYKDRVIAICRKYLKLDEQVEDACSETFFSLAKAYNRINDMEAHKMDYYIFITAKNAALKVLNKEKDYMEHVSFDEVEDTISAEELEQIGLPKLTEYIAKLTMPDKEILYLRVVNGLDYKTIGRLLNIKPNAARQRLQRAKVHLAELLEGGKLNETEF